MALNEKRHQPLQPLANDSLGFNALLASATPGENLQPGKSLDPFEQPYLQEDKDNDEYFTSNNKEAGLASIVGGVTGNL